MQTFGLQAERRQNYVLQALQSKALYGGKTPRRRRQNYVLQAIQSLQSEALYKLCKAFGSTGRKRKAFFNRRLKEGVQN